jgi:hypothetical protein
MVFVTIAASANVRASSMVVNGLDPSGVFFTLSTKSR